MAARRFHETLRATRGIFQGSVVSRFRVIRDCAKDRVQSRPIAALYNALGTLLMPSLMRRIYIYLTRRAALFSGN